MKRPTELNAAAGHGGMTRKEAGAMQKSVKDGTAEFMRRRGLIMGWRKTRAVVKKISQ